MNRPSSGAMEVKDSYKAEVIAFICGPSTPSTSSGTAVAASGTAPWPTTIAYTITASTGPIDEMPVSPNELSSFEARTEETPIPSAIINGTVIGPVVAPPESKPIPINDDGTKIATTKRIVFFNNIDDNVIQKIQDELFDDDEDEEEEYEENNNRIKNNLKTKKDHIELEIDYNTNNKYNIINTKFF